MKTAPVAEGLDVAEDFYSALTARPVNAVLAPHGLERAQEALHRSNVVPTTFPVQADLNGQVLEWFLPVLRRQCVDHFLILNDRPVHRLDKEHKTYVIYTRPDQRIQRCAPGRLFR